MVRYAEGMTAISLGRAAHPGTGFSLGLRRSGLLPRRRGQNVRDRARSRIEIGRHQSVAGRPRGPDLGHLGGRRRIAVDPVDVEALLDRYCDRISLLRPADRRGNALISVESTTGNGPASGPSLSTFSRFGMKNSTGGRPRSDLHPPISDERRRRIPDTLAANERLVNGQPGLPPGLLLDSRWAVGEPIGGRCEDDRQYRSAEDAARDRYR